MSYLVVEDCPYITQVNHREFFVTILDFFPAYDNALGNLDTYVILTLLFLPMHTL